MSERKPSKPRNKRGGERKGPDARVLAAPSSTGTANVPRTVSQRGSAQSGRGAHSCASRAQHASARRRDTRPQQRLRIVVRHLPPTLPEDVFTSTFERYSELKKVESITYLQGKMPKQKTKQPRASRAYIKFRRQEDLAAFMKAFKGHVFVNGEGHEFMAQVELAPLPKAHNTGASGSQDALMGTLADDPDYLAFLNPPEQPAVEESSEPADPRVTPLIEFLRAQKVKNDAKQKIKKAEKAKLQEEKRQAAQDLADAATEKVKAQMAAQNNADGSKSRKGKRRDAKDAESTPSQSNQNKPVVKNGKKGSASSLSVCQGHEKKAAIADVTKTGNARKSNDTCPSTKDSKAPKGKPNGSEHLTNGGPKSGKAVRKQRAPKKQTSVNSSNKLVDLSGPTPAEMAAAHAKTKT
ncbi:Smg-4/UPF3 family-domain-containing protein [Protomyces lactucae-debilis]|uniref:Smg-4/UPF3 family-domain-containing protein n=1 Tax=Protomyces lactucae-debilis TaxID=2754530 RepID=A0A1Y2FNN5_PROLT|nr:Smg-4/UPF3 family-domain-containing protein [Protomyces lactucae-debilis]ORY85578.1 Smg-4/UPF3 family-domain-containing protein [Protomyces lactucae-debilis]